MKPIHTLTINNETYDLQDHRLDQAFTHIATIEHTAEEKVLQIDITQDSKAEAFACKEFWIYCTLPTNQEIYDRYLTHLYIGHEMYHDWEAFIQTGFNRNGPRRWRIHLYHTHNGWWVTDGVYTDAMDTLDCTVSNSTYCAGNLRSMAATGETISQLHFYAPAGFGSGTKIEVYGK